MTWVPKTYVWGMGLNLLLGKALFIAIKNVGMGRYLKSTYLFVLLPFSFFFYFLCYFSKCHFFSDYLFFVLLL